jgi:integrase
MAQQTFTRFNNRNIVFAPPGRHHAGVQGLYLYVSPDAQVRRWIYRFTSPVTRRVTETGLGLVQVLPLTEARAKALDLQKQISQGICPVQARRVARSALSIDTFGQCCEIWIKTYQPGWKGVSQLKSAHVLLFTHGKALLGVPVSVITPDMVQSALSKLWTRHPIQARRALAMIGRILDFAKARGMRQGDNPASWRGNMEYRFPRLPNNHGHYAAMDYAEVPDFVRVLRTKQVRSIAARALEFLILTVARTTEVREMTWSEIDWDNKVWTLEAERMKQGRVHRVPLSARAMELLAVQRSNGSPFVFTGNRNQLSAKSMVWVLRDMDSKVTVHGFRSSFRDFCGNDTEFQREFVERSTIRSAIIKRIGRRTNGSRRTTTEAILPSRNRSWHTNGNCSITVVAVGASAD